MKHVKLFEDFTSSFGRPSIGIHDENILDLDSMTLTIYYHEDGWDNPQKFRQDLELLTKNENDPMGEEIELALAAEGLQLEDKHSHDVQFYGSGPFGYSAVVTLYLKPLEQESAEDNK